MAGVKMFRDGMHRLNDCRSLTFQLRKLKCTERQQEREETISRQNQGTQTGVCLKWFVNFVHTFQRM